MQENLILAGVPALLIPEQAGQRYEIQRIDDIWPLVETLQLREYGEYTTIIVGNISPTHDQCVQSITEIAYQLRCISPYLKMVFMGKADLWVIQELMEYDINAYVDADHPEDLTAAIDFSNRGKGFFHSSTINIKEQKEYQKLNWQQAFIIEAIAEGADAKEISFAANIENERRVYTMIATLKRRFDAVDKTKMVVKLIQAGYLVT